MPTFSCYKKCIRAHMRRQTEAMRYRVKYYPQMLDEHRFDRNLLKASGAGPCEYKLMQPKTESAPGTVSRDCRRAARIAHTRHGWQRRKCKSAVRVTRGRPGQTRGDERDILEDQPFRAPNHPFDLSRTLIAEQTPIAHHPSSRELNPIIWSSPGAAICENQ